MGIKKALCMLTLLFVFGCAAVMTMQPGEEKSAGTGDVFFSSMNPLIDKYELTVGTATNEKLSLYYNEYYQDSRTYQWIIKSGFTKTFDYNIKESKIVNFKDLKFEILNVTDGRVTYRRVN